MVKRALQVESHAWQIKCLQQIAEPIREELL
jgi:hypothetical protein